MDSETWVKAIENLCKDIESNASELDGQVNVLRKCMQAWKEGELIDPDEL